MGSIPVRWGGVYLVTNVDLCNLSGKVAPFEGVNKSSSLFKGTTTVGYNKFSPIYIYIYILLIAFSSYIISNISRGLMTEAVGIYS